MGGEIFAITSGFWNFSSLAPTAAFVSISGRVLTPTGDGLYGAVLTLQTPSGSVFLSRSSPLGYYRFDAVEVGQAVLITVTSKRFTYDTRTLFIGDEVTELDFVPVECLWD